MKSLGIAAPLIEPTPPPVGVAVVHRADRESFIPPVDGLEQGRAEEKPYPKRVYRGWR